MRKLKNTLYITSPEAYLSLEGENIVVLLGLIINMNNYVAPLVGAWIEILYFNKSCIKMKL